MTDIAPVLGSPDERAAVRRKLREWVRRYLPAEIIGTLTALAAALTVHAVSGSLISAAMAGTIGESLGYYGCIAVHEVRYYDARHRDHGTLRRRWLTGARTVRAMLIEFGPAELVDSLLARPLFMYLMPSLLHNFTAGIVAGKLAADVIFYGIAISAYELKQRYLLLPRPTHLRPTYPSTSGSLWRFNNRNMETAMPTTAEPSTNARNAAVVRALAYSDEPIK
jgi:hypothetical protein